MTYKMKPSKNHPIFDRLSAFPPNRRDDQLKRHLKAQPPHAPIAPADLLYSAIIIADVLDRGLSAIALAISTPTKLHLSSLIDIQRVVNDSLERLNTLLKQPPHTRRKPTKKEI